MLSSRYIHPSSLFEHRNTLYIYTIPLIPHASHVLPIGIICDYSFHLSRPVKLSDRHTYDVIHTRPSERNYFMGGKRILIYTRYIIGSG